MVSVKKLSEARNRQDQNIIIQLSPPSSRTSSGTTAYQPTSLPKPEKPVPKNACWMALASPEFLMRAKLERLEYFRLDSNVLVEQWLEDTHQNVRD